MFTSNPNGNDPNNVCLPFLNDILISSNSKQDQQDLILPFSLLNFPSPPFSIEDSALFLHPFEDYSLPDNKIDPMESSKQPSSNPNGSSNKNNSVSQSRKIVPRSRSSKKDRHSKINTAQGPRDRRMRLSLEVARKFFDLQDMLGFDKASKTVEWLLTKSKSAIKDLLEEQGAGESSQSDWDVVSGVIDDSVDASNDNNDGDDPPEKLPDENSKESKEPVISGKVKKTSRSQVSARRISCKESREKARERAKERTREKMLVRSLKGVNNGLLKPFEVGETQLGQKNLKLTSIDEVRAEVDDPTELGIISEQIINSSFTNTSNYLQSNGTLIQENQFRDLQLFLKPWEAYTGTSYFC